VLCVSFSCPRWLVFDLTAIRYKYSGSYFLSWLFVNVRYFVFLCSTHPIGYLPSMANHSNWSGRMKRKVLFWQDLGHGKIILKVLSTNIDSNHRSTTTNLFHLNWTFHIPCLFKSVAEDFAPGKWGCKRSSCGIPCGCSGDRSGGTFGIWW
jgi:hypothetical protein